MSKKLALFLCLFLILLLGWSLFGPWGGLAVTVNGHVVRGPLGGLLPYRQVRSGGGLHVLIRFIEIVKSRSQPSLG